MFNEEDPDDNDSKKVIFWLLVIYFFSVPAAIAIFLLIQDLSTSPIG